MQRSRLGIFFTILFFIILFILLHYFGFLRSTEQFLRSGLSPLSQWMYNFSGNIKQSAGALSSNPKERIRGLEEELRSCHVESVTQQQLQSENQELKLQLEFFQADRNLDHVGASVIARNIQPLGSTLIIDRGTNDGISVGDAVVISKGILIGKIAQTESESSMVRLLNDNQSKIAATLLNHDKSVGVIEGGYGISVRMNFIPQQEDVRVGDLVISSGLERGLPRGLLIGNVVAVEKEPYQPFQTAVLSPEATLSNISIVSIIRMVSSSPSL
jgi:rod shape-determining protein MreC